MPSSNQLLAKMALISPDSYSAGNVDVTGGDISFTYLDGMSVKSTTVSAIISDINAGMSDKNKPPNAELTVLPSCRVAKANAAKADAADLVVGQRLLIGCP